MESTQSVEIISKMIQESRKSLHRNSFYFILWGSLLIPAGIAEYFMLGTPNYWMIWPAIGIIGGIVSSIYGSKESKRSGVQTAGDRITSYTWGAFGATLIFVIIYSVSKGLTPHPLILITAGLATFISGGISKFKPFVMGGVFLGLGAIASGFFIDPEFHGLVFSTSILLGYVIPGVQLRKVENGQA